MMTRSEYEAKFGRKVIKPCPHCELRQQQRREVRLRRHRRNKAQQAALKAGIESGKVIHVWHIDAFTGWHYIDYKGRQEITGIGDH